MKRLLFVAAVLCMSLSSGSVHAGIDADPSKEYKVVPEAGPWMIRAAVFVGPEARSMAHEIVMEIRTRDKLPAWVYNHGDEERRKRQEYIEQMRQKYGDARIKLTRIQDECAVLIGGYKDADTAAKALKKIRKLAPPTNENLMPTLHEIDTSKEIIARKAKEELSPGERLEVQTVHVNPFVTSFVVHNPTVPVERHVDKSQEVNLKKLNAGEDYSVFHCKKDWTIVVACYVGASAIVPKENAETFLEKLGKPHELTDASALQAHEMAKMLREKMRVDAYVLHLRSASLVTVGGYQSEDDPEIPRMQGRMKSLKFASPVVQFLPDMQPIRIPR